MQYRTRRLNGRPVQTTKAQDDMLTAALGWMHRGAARVTTALTGRSFTPLVRRGLAESIRGDRTLTSAGVQLATMIRDERLNREPAKRPEYRVRPEITAHDRVLRVGSIVTVNIGVDRWRVDAVQDGAAYVRPETAPGDAQGMWCSLNYLYFAPDAQNGSQAVCAHPDINRMGEYRSCGRGHLTVDR